MFKIITELRLREIRRALSRNKIGGFLISKFNNTSNKKNISSNGVIEWLSGFSGSNGLIIITHNSCAIFVDGRYILQFEKEINKYLIEIYPFDFDTIACWVRLSLDKCVLGYDPWSVTLYDLLKYRSFDIALLPSYNLLADISYKDRSINNIIFNYLEKYSGENSSSRCYRVSSVLRNRKLDFALIVSPDSICWLLNIRGSNNNFKPVVLSNLILKKDGSVIWFRDINPLNSLYFQSHIKHDNYDKFYNYIFNLKNRFTFIDIMSIPLIVFEYVNFAESYNALGTDICILNKSCKNTIEQDGFRLSHIKDGIAVTKSLYWIHSQIDNANNNINEFLISQKLLSLRKEQSFFQFPSFGTISSYGSNSSVIHYQPHFTSSSNIGKESLYLLDSGGQYLHGTTDVTRTCCFGNPTEKQKKYFTSVLKGNISLSMIRFEEGTCGQQLDILARNYLWISGLNYNHSTGHGVGTFLSVHEGPQGISCKSSHPILPGMVISNEPGYYKDNFYGIRIENLMLAKEDYMLHDEGRMMSFETLTLIPIQISLIKRDMLNSLEIEWLNNYHHRVFKTLSPFLDPNERCWLKESTKTI